METRPDRRHSSHWGAFLARDLGEGRLSVRASAEDPAPSPLLRNFETALRHPARASRPLARRGWLQDGPGPDPRRGTDDFVEIPWDEALDRAAAEMARLGAGAVPPEGEANGPVPGTRVFGGSYGWASAGRFHHAQSQVHRFLNCAFGGYVASVDTYSSAAGSAILSKTWGNSARENRERPLWREIETTTEILLSFGGMALRNLAVSSGGMSRHGAGGALARAAARGCALVSVSPLPDDAPDLPGLRHVPIRPGTDVALMLGLAYRLLEAGKVDREYLARCTVGFEALEAYILGRTDGTPKTPDWASAICTVPAPEIIALADRIGEARTLINVTYSLQRAENGEQPVWMALALASMLGGDREGAGFSYGMGSIGAIGEERLAVPLPTLPQGVNRSGDFIPVARVADMLLQPGGAYGYKGEPRVYPDIRMVVWAGGNPFHHHQDLGRLSRAFQRPDTVIALDPYLTATTRHADLVFPATLSLEREDIGAASNDPYVHAMEQVAPPEGARDDFEIFGAIADRLGCGAAFHEGLSSRDWLERIWAPTRDALRAAGRDAPEYSALREGMRLTLPTEPAPASLARFHADPEGNPRPTRSGKIELSCPEMAAARLPEHPAWIEPADWLGGALAQARPFQLIANQPPGRLHSQLDFGDASAVSKIEGREAARMNPGDAARLGLSLGDPVLLRSDRGACIAAAKPDPAIPASIIQLSTGAWHAPVEIAGIGAVCVNGNPNAVTHDRGASGFSGGCAGQLTLVSAEAFPDAPPPVPHHALLARATEGAEG